MTQITSPQNPRLKAVKRLATRRERDRAGRFAAEGEDLVLAAAQAGRTALAGYRAAGSQIGGAAFHDVEPAALRAASTLGSGTRVIGVYEQRWGPATGPLCVYLHGVGDPGNVGTIVRSAQAFGASCVALGPGCADPHSPKAVRASMGAIFSVALASCRASAWRSSPMRPTRCAGSAGTARTARSRFWSAPSATACRRRSSPRASAARASRSRRSRSTPRWRRRWRCMR